MSETYMITAKTVEEAIAIANREYADETHEVSYEIIDMPKKGFLGIGARDAKIKVTVTKSVSADLDSLVADLKSMKVLTGKGDSGETRKERQPKQNQNQPKQSQQNKPKQNQNAQNAQNSQKKNDQPKQNDGKPQQNQPKNTAQNSPVNNSPVNNSPVNKGDKQPVQQNNQPKKNDKPAVKTTVKKDKPVQPKAENVEAKAEKAEAIAEKFETKAEKIEAAEKKQNISSLRNQAKPGKRQAQKKHDPGEAEIASSGTTVSTPVGLTDYVADGKANGFGSSSNSGTGTMSNDVRRKKNSKNSANASSGANANANANVLKPGKTFKNNSVIYEDRSSMTTRYDVAESDEDYKKLDCLEDRELTIDEIRASVKMSGSVQAEEAAEAAEEAIEPKSEKLRREAVSEAEMNFALEFANTLLRNMGLDASAVPAECPEGEEFDTTEECTVYPKINIIGDDTGILIGHHGETLDAIQYLVNLSALRKSKQKDGDYVKIVVDIENYREKREETLRALARRMASRAVKYKRNVFLEPMNAYERRIIHSELQSFENVSTHSVGNDRDRKIIITYEGADKATDNRRRGRKGHGKGNNAQNVNETATETTAVEEGVPANNSGNAQKERRRPRKVQKMPIEKIGDILPDAVDAADAVENDTAVAEAENE